MVSVARIHYLNSLRHLIKIKDNPIEVQFINILKSTDAQQVEEYARAYHEKFTSPILNKEQKELLFKQFSIVEESTYAPDLKHSNFLFLLMKSENGKWLLDRAFPDVDSCILYMEKRNSSNYYFKTMTKTYP